MQQFEEEKILNLKSVEDITLFDVTNLSLGIKIKNNVFSEMIPRSSAIPYKSIKTFKTSHDNQTSANVEVFEGETIKDCDKNNLSLGKFVISGLPKRKEGEVKVEVKIEIKENSILEVTATEKDNKNNFKNLIIERLNDFAEIIDELKERGNRISLFENKKYNEIKLIIIEFEEELRKQKNKKEKDDTNYKSIFKSLIEYLGAFLMKNVNFSNLYISFIKYYFNKVCEFYQMFQFKNEQELDKIKNHMSYLLEQIQFYNRELILEIIEEFVDVDNIYKNFMDLIMQSLWDDINTIVTLAKISNGNYDQILKDLSKAKSLIQICSEMIDKFDKDKIKFNNILKSDLKNINLKIKVKEKIIEHKTRGFFASIFTSDKTELTQLYEEYFNDLSFEPEDLNELGRIIGINKSNNTKNNYQNFENEFDKALKFIEYLEKRDKYDDTYSTISKILTDYPYERDNNVKEDKMWEEFYKLKGGEYSFYEYLLIIRASYQNLMNSGFITDIERNVYEAILQYLNKKIKK